MTPLMSIKKLTSLLGDKRLIVLDCRFQLVSTPQDPHAGYSAYLAQHIPNAHYVDLNRDMSSAVVADVTGRHPLPSPTQLQTLFNAVGLADDSIVVCYDASGGAFAVRMWWLLQWCGFSSTALLDGGWQAWLAANGAVSQDIPAALQGTFQLQSTADWVITAKDIVKNNSAFQLFDARGTDRFHGQNETIDPVAGHIPNAHSMPFTDNLDARGNFKSAGELKKRFLVSPSQTTTVHYCGSGVTACHNWFAMTLAGIPPGKLYAGSWSDWITDPTRPIET